MAIVVLHSGAKINVKQSAKSVRKSLDKVEEGNYVSLKSGESTASGARALVAPTAVAAVYDTGDESFDDDDDS